jgi:hypothetical protein
VRTLQQVRYTPIGQELDSIECEGRAGAVPHEPLARGSSTAVIRCDAHRAMHVELQNQANQGAPPNELVDLVGRTTPGIDNPSPELLIQRRFFSRDADRVRFSMSTSACIVAVR